MKVLGASSVEQQNADWLARNRPCTTEPVVLIVDDSDADIFFLLRAFTRSGVKNPVKIVRTGAEALAYLGGVGKFANRGEYPLPGIVILDLCMPHPDGFEILKWKQAKAELKDVLFVALSNIDSTKAMSKAYRAGAATFLSKPLECEEILNLIQSFERHWAIPARRSKDHSFS
jgi:CheY-like chemotaxis protein